MEVVVVRGTLFLPPYPAYPFTSKVTEMGAHPCGPSCSACPRSSIFLSRPRSCTTYFSRSRIPMLLQFNHKVLSGAQYGVWLVPNAPTWGCYYGGGGEDNNRTIGTRYLIQSCEYHTGIVPRPCTL